MPMITQITKQMSDGWTIIETYEEGKGLTNKYFFDGRLAPSIRMTDNISKQYGAYSLIEKDLRSVIFWLNEIENLKPEVLERVKNPEKMNLIKGLFVAALTFYGKAFTSCEGRKVKLEKKIFDKEDQEIHEKIMKLRHHFAAHSGAERFEKVDVSLTLHPDENSEMKPKLYSELSQPDNFTNEGPKFKKLVEKLRVKVLEKREEVGEIVFEKVVRPKGKMYWYEQAKLKIESGSVEK